MSKLAWRYIALALIVALASTTLYLAYSYLKLKGLYEGLKDSYEGLSLEHQALEASYRELEGDYAYLRGELAKLVDELNKLNQSYTELQRRHLKLEESYAELNRALNESLTVIAKLERQLPPGHLPTWEVGYYWVYWWSEGNCSVRYEVVDLEVERVFGDVVTPCYVLNVTVNGAYNRTELRAVDDPLWTVLEVGELGYPILRMYLVGGPWPLTVNETTLYYEILVYDIEKGIGLPWRNFLLNVTGLEEVEVQAGSFKCFRVEVKGGGLSEVYWYSDEVGFLVKAATSKGTFSLIEWGQS